MAKKRKNKNVEVSEEETLVIPTANFDALSEYLRLKGSKSFEEHLQNLTKKIAEKYQEVEGTKEGRDE